MIHVCKRKKRYMEGFLIRDVTVSSSGAADSTNPSQSAVSQWDWGFYTLLGTVRAVSSRGVAFSSLVRRSYTINVWEDIHVVYECMGGHTRSLFEYIFPSLCEQPFVCILPYLVLGAILEHLI